MALPAMVSVVTAVFCCVLFVVTVYHNGRIEHHELDTRSPRNVHSARSAHSTHKAHSGKTTSSSHHKHADEESERPLRAKHASPKSPQSSSSDGFKRTHYSDGFKHAPPRVFGAPLALGENPFAADDPVVAAALNRTKMELLQLGPIPRVLHVSAKKAFPLHSGHAFLKDGVDAFMRLNPDWELKISNDSTIDAYLKAKLSRADFDRISRRHIVEKGDLWRLLIMYYEGGLYMDLDRLCNQPLKLNAKLKMLLAIGASDFSQDFVCSAPHNPILWTAIQLNVLKREACMRSSKGSDLVVGLPPSGVQQSKLCGIYHLGPITYLNALSAHILGKQVARVNSTRVLSEALLRLKSLSPRLSVYKELAPFNTVLFKEPQPGEPSQLIYGESTASPDWKVRVEAARGLAKEDFYRTQGFASGWSRG